MEKMKIFMDTHDRADGTFPAGITSEQFAAFFAGYQEACREEGVVLLRVDVGLEAGRAFCLSMAADAEAVRRAHDRVGLSYASITEVKAATPGSLFFKAEAA